ncbi:mandelate racemase [Hoeflea sp. G2-23]|uniref:Mandelate racemase n=1 Tax=Hoeflea algicola TaxID=2983763 RepID=A0ABT3Z8T8_9HYPH|nr:enolase C-terminal domain-like protein [Hoeflea algicola]MCY0148178.1 mandelate racemase [Hoeflea algicola]
MLTIDGVKTQLIEVPLRFVLGTSAAQVKSAPLLLVDLFTKEGITGRTYLFTYRRSGGSAIAALLEDAVEVVKGKLVDPVAIGALLERRFALLGVVGTARMALAALDMALWDAKARAANLPLATMLGSSPRPILAYNSCGLGLMSPEAAADEAEALLEGGFSAAKLRLGYPTLNEDLAVLRAVRNRLDDEIRIMVDYNQALTVTEALQRGRAIEAEGAYWIEEPIRHDDWAGNRKITQTLNLPMQIGENFNSPAELAEAYSERATDWVMPDAGRIGGVTGWIHAAGIAAAHGLEMSSHLLPEVSGHLLCATPTAHWLEYVDWADAILVDPPKVVDGFYHVPNTPGIGMEWDHEKVEKLLV